MISDRFERLAAARLYLVCGELEDDRLDAALLGGVQLVQLRMKAVAPDAIVDVSRRYAAICSRHGAPFILNDHPELVDEAGADGVHLGQDDMPVGRARELLGPKRIVGLSTHDMDQVDAAHRMGVDYIGVGPVNVTPTKPGRPAVGTELVSAAARRAELPFFAIGGIDTSNVEVVLRAGARRVAVVRAIAQADDPQVAARDLRAALDSRVRIGAA